MGNVPDPVAALVAVNIAAADEWVLFGRLKDLDRVHTRYDRCARTFMSAICVAATVIFWL